ncbi:hypothetical protein EO98_06070 [Methanosarcina sp. 2.H.T.1A.6]|uniref:hypothetical protein n=1 Tax=unclassified Methanosarcina TaxID=2644672 RepID=UPI0006221EAA|nr:MULTISPECIES: hypothetical protein [unclassified Methanosarcina]KKG14502.1 hypothetical protein EO94_14295 [Methanosarcina sp. 2.H.T.1A.3]KKG18278.1 hypothetical protein EO97_01455 [Methanosarcina sp. 2.H.T.1A.15]KKG24246.1 hypothetical protein EO96_00955 [Methanosarcina sp. 2.H.T.1A.8]KKG24941.1 hypothetical protein EO98_06070 [Methanosarcina sp. 2.H.T.1A.6]
MLGAAIQSNGHDLKVTMQFKVGNDTLDPWNYALPVAGNVNDSKTHLWNLPAIYPAGMPVSISGKSWNSGDHDSTLNTDWTKLYEVKSDTNSPCVKVLRNGDSVPNIPGFMNQNSIAEFVDDYVENVKIVLDGKWGYFPV